MKSSFLFLAYPISESGLNRSKISMVYLVIAWYVALLYAAMGWGCAAALDENPWYVALLHSEGGWACGACATAPDKSTCLQNG